MEAATNFTKASVYLKRLPICIQDAAQLSFSKVNAKWSQQRFFTFTSITFVWPRIEMEIFFNDWSTYWLSFTKTKINKFMVSFYSNWISNSTIITHILGLYGSLNSRYTVKVEIVKENYRNILPLILFLI